MTDALLTLPPALRARACVDALCREVDGQAHAVRIEAAPDGWQAVARIATQSPVELSRLVRVMESLGCRVVTGQVHEIAPVGFGSSSSHEGRQLHELVVEGQDVDRLIRPKVHKVVKACVEQTLEVDSLNELAVMADLSASDLMFLRCLRQYHTQRWPTVTAATIDRVLLRHPRTVALLIGVVAERFDPRIPENLRASAVVQGRLDRAVAMVDRHDDATVLGALVRLLQASVRTNRYQIDVDDDSDGRALALKIDGRQLDEDNSAPAIETFVYAPGLEGVHLRAGLVARGGLRLSDRPDDYRAEVLDLFRAQVRKNALIVPVGAKGAFVSTRSRELPSAEADESRAAYAAFVGALLSITDTMVEGQIRRPPAVVAHDPDDPYLVVAADRGTAHFSDLANEVAGQSGFWLGDAFASGGSSGFNHKELGITARGAWLAVRHHFAELGIDVQQEPVTVAGIGDMSGDVFGNAALQSKTIRLVAAFDHRHVFLDPDPDMDASFQERRRLFEAPASSWDDYDRSRIARGGGVYSRSARSIPLSPEARALLRVEASELSGPALVRAVLGAPVDLLFFGGIGTYVKATDERHREVSDPLNDEARVDASMIRARVVGEGANLGMTQRARIELAQRGGRCNQDAVDNAAGVAISDREVNLKMLLSMAVERGAISSAERAALLSDATVPVVESVLADLESQLHGLRRCTQHAASDVSDYGEWLGLMAVDPQAHQQVTGLPTSDRVDDLASHGAGLTRPELVSIIAASKQMLQQQLVRCDEVEDDRVREFLREYFPSSLPDVVKALAPEHPLAKDIAAAVVANRVVDDLGPTFCHVLASRTNVPAAWVALAHTLVSEILDLRTCWSGVKPAGGPYGASSEIERELIVLARETTRAILAAGDLSNAAQTAYSSTLRTLVSGRSDIVAGTHSPSLDGILRNRDLVLYLPMLTGLVISSGADPVFTVTVARRVQQELGVDLLTRRLHGLATDSTWTRRHCDALADDAMAVVVHVASELISAGTDLERLTSEVHARLGAHQEKVRGLQRASALIPENPLFGIHAVSVELRELRQALDCR